MFPISINNLDLDSLTRSEYIAFLNSLINYYEVLFQMKLDLFEE